MRLALRPAFVSLAVLPIASLTVGVFLYHREPESQPWTPAKLRQLLQRDGWECQSQYAADGRWLRLCLRRPGDETPWETFAGATLLSFASQRGRLRVVYHQCTGGELLNEGTDEGRIDLDRLRIEGHSDELRRVIDLVRR